MYQIRNQLKNGYYYVTNLDDKIEPGIHSVHQKFFSCQINGEWFIFITALSIKIWWVCCVVTIVSITLMNQADKKIIMMS